MSKKEQVIFLIRFYSNGKIECSYNKGKWKVLRCGVGLNKD